VRYTDLELIHLWQQGSEFAFEQLYKRYASQLLAIAMRKTNDREVSEEFVQDTFLIFYNNGKTAEKLTSVMGYLHTILKNKILDHYRHSVVHKKYEAYIMTHFEEKDNSTEQSLVTKELESQLVLNIEKLPPQCRNVYKLSRQEYLSVKEIAKRLDISENTVKQHMRKALRLLRISLVNYEKILFIIITVKIFYNRR
jgi:RNA polymerase sigma-70 factor (ECF subfamily)